MRKIVSLLLIIATLFVMISCGKEYRTDLSTNELSQAVLSKLSNPDILVLADEYYIESFNSEYTPLVKEYSIMYSKSGTSFDEFGIFKVENSADTQKITTMIDEYKNLRVESDMGYVPEELPKIKDAQIKVVGNYVMYAFLSSTDKSVAFSEFESKLVK